VTFYACTPIQTYTAEILTPRLVEPRARKSEPARPRARAKARQINYKSRNRPGTIAKQEAITRWLKAGDEGFTVTELAALLGISRQLCLYHVKKMAAQAQLVMILEPCDGNGGLQYKVWDKLQLVVNYVPAVAREAA
jgi:hypothetical protein